MKKKFLVFGCILALSVGLSVPACAAVHPTLDEHIDVVNYDPAVDYMSKMHECAEDGSKHALMMGSIYEAQRNLKIETEGLDEHELTNFDWTNADTILVEIEKYLGVYVEPAPEPEPPAYTQYYTENDVTMIAQVMYLEARGIKSKTEIACIGWVILNRYNAGYANSISGVITAPNQFAWYAGAPTVSDYGYDLKALARDVLERWNREKNGETNVGRVLPSDYLWYAGRNGHNWFRNSYSGGSYWNYAWGYLYG